jgi:Family of unknown function (DUF5681)
MTATTQHSPARAPKRGAGAAHEDAAPAQERAYEVGRGKPPPATRFRKGQSGNPGGRPRGAATTASALVLEEAYRTVTVKDGEGFSTMPAIRAVVRSQVALATKGNGPAQRSVIAMVQAVEHERAVAAAAEAAAGAASQKPVSPIETGRRIAFLLHLAKREIKAKREAAAARGEPPIEPAPEDALIEEYFKDPV